MPFENPGKQPKTKTKEVLINDFTPKMRERYESSDQEINALVAMSGIPFNELSALAVAISCAQTNGDGQQIFKLFGSDLSEDQMSELDDATRLIFHYQGNPKAITCAQTLLHNMSSRSGLD